MSARMSGHRMIAALVVSLWLGGVSGAAVMAQTAQTTAPAAAPQSADARLKALYDAEYQWRLAEYERGPGRGAQVRS